MILVTSINGHAKPEPLREVIAAGPEGAFFCVTHGPRKRHGGYEGYESIPKRLSLNPGFTGIPGEPTILKIYYTADMGRELFRVESGVPKSAEKQEEKRWWMKLIIRRRRSKDVRKADSTTRV